jgi:hypothetical protein
LRPPAKTPPSLFSSLILVPHAVPITVHPTSTNTLLFTGLHGITRCPSALFSLISASFGTSASSAARAMHLIEHRRPSSWLPWTLPRLPPGLSGESLQSSPLSPHELSCCFAPSSAFAPGTRSMLLTSVSTLVPTDDPQENVRARPVSASHRSGGNVDSFRAIRNLRTPQGRGFCSPNKESR